MESYVCFLYQWNHLGNKEKHKFQAWHWSSQNRTMNKNYFLDSKKSQSSWENIHVNKEFTNIELCVIIKLYTGFSGNTNEIYCMHKI